MKIDTQATTEENYEAYLKEYEENAKRLVGIVSQDVRTAAIDLIQGGSPAGTLYTGRGKGRPNHQASAPGQPPASDTGNLKDMIAVEIDSDGMGADIESRAKYSAALEFGATNTTTGALIEARPFMQPAADQARAEAKRKGRSVMKAKRVRKGGSAARRKKV